MTPCCEHTVTPKMIKNGEMKIGDKILFEDEPQSVEAASYSIPKEPETKQTQQNQEQEKQEQQIRQEQQKPQEQHKESMQQEPSKPNEAMQEKDYPSNRLVNNRVAASNTSNSRSDSQSINIPLTYKEMTPYMELTSITDINNNPMLTVPPSPLATDNYTEAIDITDVQAFTGFLRTQIGRYMRIEQLIGSNTIEERYGFLVGIGTNFIILQDIIAGNIMLIDLFTIKLTYIYYSEPVLPRGTI